ncbi:MAG: ergothioneine biosynthesis protein EgtB [Acidobacteria bacterium]|nr:ergothioneine biosynthesis protein EgtB [Acidobacteriota bacterium]MCA1637119.1 ergothioneine biosynthesis protein EgtB [Acidobacteriota bacterium]
MQATQAQRISPQELESFYSFVRNYTEEICEPLETEDYIPQPVVDVSPPKWNIAHTTWFFEEMILKKFAENYQEFNPNFGYLFNSYYNSVGERTLRQNRGDLSRPTVKEVYQYRNYVDKKMGEFLRQDLSNEVRDLIVLGLNHEQQHQELLITDIKYTFGCNPLFPVYKKDFALVEKGETENYEKNEYVNVSAGRYEIGFNGDGFHFDNEQGRHTVYLQDFEISKNLVTNGEFLEFIEDGGYENFNLWHSEGLDWVKQNQIKSPLYWQKHDGEWFQFTLGGLRKLKPENAVCHISYYEATAFAEWKSLRLPTEFEWETASDLFNWGLRWEWTNSAYLPYPNFKKPAGAVGEYNGKFMINQMVLRGSSVATPLKHSRKTYRNFFHPHLRWQFTGIRLAK